MWLTWANGLTLMRLAAAPAAAFAVAVEAYGSAAALFALAVLTDLVDGPLARARGQASPLGAVLDHGTDATFIVLVLGALAANAMLPLALPVLVAAAFTQYVVDSRAHAGQPLRASYLGRVNGIAYFVLGGLAIGNEAVLHGALPAALLKGLGWLLVVTTVLSMTDRALAARSGRLGS